MLHLKKIIIILSICTTLSVNAQTVFQEDFNTDTLFSTWNITDKVEQALWLGKENSNFVRFHPNFQNQFIETPSISLTSGNYMLYFDWNQARMHSNDSVIVQLTNDNGTSWQTIYAIYNGNNRDWQTDSVEFNNISGAVKLKWNYFSAGSFPSQYFNLENVLITKNISTSIKSNLNDIRTDVFPNPNNGNFQLKILNSKNKKGNIIIYNMQGELIYQHYLPAVSQSLLQIEFSDLSKGSYILNIETDESSYSKNIIIQ